MPLINIREYLNCITLVIRWVFRLDYGLESEFDRFMIQENPGSVIRPLQGDRESMNRLLVC